MSLRPSWFASVLCLGLYLSAVLPAADNLPIEAPHEPFSEEMRDSDAQRWWAKAVNLPAYQNATADKPFFDSPGLWPANVKNAEYAKFAWPKGRTLVWAGTQKDTKDGWNPKYWTENGKPATKGFDPTTDLVIPDGWGNISLTDGRKYQPSAFRHLTVGKGYIIWGHFSVQGNLWVKRGGGVQYLDSAVGGGQCFWRDDNIDGGQNLRGRSLVDHFHFNKTKDASAEFIGIFRSEDNWQVNSGTLIIGPESEVGMGNRTPPFIHKDAAVIIMDGGLYARRKNCDWGDDLTIEGTVQGGTKERPLTGDARLAVGWKSKGQFLGSTAGGGRIPGIHDVGLRVAESGIIRAFIAPKSTGRLVLNSNRRNGDYGQIEILSRSSGMTGEDLYQKVDSLSRRVDLVIRGTVLWPGIFLDDIKKGGIQIATKPDLTGTGKGPTFGTFNEGSPAELFSALTP